MTSMSVWAALAIFLLFVATVKADEGGVTFWREKFKMTCPEEGQWYDDKATSLTGEDKLILEFTYSNEKKGRYYCQYGSEKYYFYVQGKVCDNCFELDGNLLIVAIIGDIVLTVSVMMIIFRCTKKKGSAGPAHTPKTPARPAGRGPPAQSSEFYQSLNPNTRSDGTYSVVNRTG